MFQGVEIGSGEFWYVPVIIANEASRGNGSCWCQLRTETS
jgi:hypothetical protein